MYGKAWTPSPLERFITAVLPIAGKIFVPIGFGPNHRPVVNELEVPVMCAEEVKSHLNVERKTIKIEQKKANLFPMVNFKPTIQREEMSREAKANAVLHTAMHQLGKEELQKIEVDFILKTIKMKEEAKPDGIANTWCQLAIHYPRGRFTSW